MKRNSFSFSKIAAFVLLLFSFTGTALNVSRLQAEGLRDRLEGLVFEVEDWTEPKAWNVDRATKDQWQLWTKEERGIEKRSGGASLVTPKLSDVDRSTPEDGAPPLHTRITGIPNGHYQVFCGPSNRPLAYSFDGQNWLDGGSGENCFGNFEITDGTFELWVDDRFASPQNPGSAYYDYLRFVPSEDLPKISFAEAFTLPDGTTQISWLTSQKTSAAAVEVREPKSEKALRFTEELDGMRNHRVVLTGLPQGETCTARICLPVNWKGDVIEQTLTFRAGDRPIPGATQKTSVLLTVTEPTDAPRRDWPVISGVPFPKGVLANAENVRLISENGTETPAQFETFATWEDGSVKWLLCTFRATTRSREEASVTFRLETSPEFHSQPGVSPVSEAEMRKFAASLKSNVQFADGSETNCNPKNFQLVSQGRQAAVFQSVDDFLPAEGEKDFLTGYEITFFGDDLVRVRTTLANRQLKDEMTLVRSASIFVPGGKDSPGISILQDREDHCVIETGHSSTENQKSENELSNGQRFEGLLTTSDGAFWLRDFWQTWPKGLTCGEGQVGFRLLPELPAGYAPKDDSIDELFQHYYWLKDGCYQFKRGMELRHDFWVVKPGREVAAVWLQNPLFACASAEYYCSAGVFPPVNPAREGHWDAYEDAFRQGFANLEKGRVLRGEYGWMNFGDWYGERIFNWGNLEYDLSWVCALFFARTADPAILTRGIESARHYATVDRKAYLWNPADRERQFTHCYGHVNQFFTKEDPQVREFVKNLKYDAFRWESDGSGGHSFQPGAYFIACLTGDRYVWNAAASSCWRQAERYTPNYDFKIERAAGWPISNAVFAYRFTHNPYYLNAARLYVEVVNAKQNSETGCFDLPQDQSECDCPDKKEHRGGKAFAVGVLLHGLIRFDETVPDEAARKDAETVIVRCADWLLDCAWNEAQNGFRYKTGCPKYANSGRYSILAVEGIAYASKLTGEPRYLDFLARTMPEHLTAVSGSGPSAGKDFTQRHRQTPLALYWLEQYQNQQVSPSEKKEEKKPISN